MNTLALYTEYRLLSSDEVAVPGLGTFRSEQIEASFEGDEALFFPPRRRVTFTAEADCDSVGDWGVTPSAIGEAGLRELMTTVRRDGHARFGALGDFHFDDDRNLRFTPSQGGVTTRSLYGLDALCVRPLLRKKKAKKADGHITIRLRKAVVGYVAAACVALALIFAFSAPSGETLERVQASVFPVYNTVEAVDSVEEPTPAMEEPIETVAEEPTTDASEASVDEWTLVIASAIPLSKAERYAAELNSRGFVSARAVEGRVVRVVVGHYASASEAEQAVRELHNRGSEYKDAWVWKQSAAG